MEKIREALRKLDPQATYVIGVSGGPDSMALLHLAVSMGLDVIVALVNYHKRVDSDLDYELVKAYAKSHGLRLAYLEVNEYTKENFQAQARTIRYRFFVETVHRYQAKGILLAHHADDCVETILMQKARHTRVPYLGIAPLSYYQGVPVYRPCLGVFKEDLAHYCEVEGVAYRIDSSNLENHYTRNYFRNVVLKKTGREEKERLLSWASVKNEQVQRQQDKLEALLASEVTSAIWQIDLSHDDKTLGELLDCFLRQDQRLDPRRISAALIREGVHMLRGKKNSQMDLPDGFQLKKQDGQVYVCLKTVKLSYAYQIDAPQELQTSYFSLQTRGQDREGIPVRMQDFPLTIRTIQPGDAMELSYGTKKVSRLFIDAKIPREKRQLWPIVCDCHGRILLVPKIAKNKDYLMEKATLFVVQ